MLQWLPMLWDQFLHLWQLLLILQQLVQRFM
jgi:hypothetical protein